MAERSPSTFEQNRIGHSRMAPTKSSTNITSFRRSREPIFRKFFSMFCIEREKRGKAGRGVGGGVRMLEYTVGEKCSWLVPNVGGTSGLKSAPQLAKICES